MDDAIRRLESRHRAGDPEAWAPYVQALQRAGRLPGTVRVRVVYEGGPLVGKTTNFQRLHADGSLGERRELFSWAHRGDRLLQFRLASGRLTPLGLEVDLVTVPGSCWYLDLTKMKALLSADAVVYVASGVYPDRDREYHDLLGVNLSALGASDLPRVYQWNQRDRSGVTGAQELAATLEVPVDVTQIEAVAVVGRGVRESFEAALSPVVEALRADPVRALAQQVQRRGRALAGFRPRLDASRRDVADGTVDLQALIAYEAEVGAPRFPLSPVEAPAERGWFRRLFGF